MPFCAYCGSEVAETSWRPCPSCGNPNNGAPKPRLATGGQNAAVIAIIAAVLSMLAVPIAGIVAAIFIPNYLTALQRARQKRTMADMRDIGRAIEAERQGRGAYPETFTPSTNDGWGRPFIYQCLGRDDGQCVSYGVASAGSDGQLEHDSLGQYEAGEELNFNADIVYVDGRFVQSPMGVTE